MYEEWGDERSIDGPRGTHEHECRSCGYFWECHEEECQLRPDTLCARCHEEIYPERYSPNSGD